MRYGRLVNLKRQIVGPEELIDSIARWMPYTDFEPFKGDAAAALKLSSEAPASSSPDFL
jgi:hypothetical protein